MSRSLAPCEVGGHNGTNYQGVPGMEDSAIARLKAVHAIDDHLAR